MLSWNCPQSSRSLARIRAPSRLLQSSRVESGALCQSVLFLNETLGSWPARCTLGCLHRSLFTWTVDVLDRQEEDVTKLTLVSQSTTPCTQPRCLTSGVSAAASTSMIQRCHSEKETYSVVERREFKSFAHDASANPTSSPLLMPSNRML